jgi:hypothetical protein
MRLKALALTTIFTSLVFIGCNQSNNNAPQNPPPPGPNEPAGRNQLALSVVDQDGKPVSGAKVLIGAARDTPFQNNFVTTDSNGVFQAPKDWTAPLPVTIQGPLHLRATYFDQMPSGQTFKLHPAASQFSREIKGLATGLEAFIKDRDGWVDFAVVSPLVTLEDLLLFQANQLISPEKDVIHVAGQRIELPSNLSLPRQNERYGIIPFTVEKSIFKTIVAKDKDIHILAGRGRAKVSTLVSNGEGADILNALTFTGGGIQTIPAGTQPLNQSLAVTGIEFSGKAPVTAPTLPAGDIMASMALSTYSGTQLMVTDAKLHSSGQTWELATVPDKANYLVFVWSKPEGSANKASSLMVAGPGRQNFNTNFLPLVARPVLSGQNLTLSPPQTTQNITTRATYISLSDVEPVRTANYEVARSSKKWEFYVNDWAGKLQLPVWPEQDAPLEHTSRWDVLYLGQEAGVATTATNAFDFSSTTHVTRNYIDIGSRQPTD